MSFGNRSPRHGRQRGRGPWLVLAFSIAPLALSVAQPLPAPSRTVYKCTVDGKTTYTDSPCLGAARVDVEPTRGLDKDSGKQKVGRDVRREQQREQMAEALRPITGLDHEQLALRQRRMKLAPKAQQECAALDAAMARAEAQERAAPADGRAEVQRELFAQRSRYKALGC